MDFGLLRPAGGDVLRFYAAGQDQANERAALDFRRQQFGAQQDLRAREQAAQAEAMRLYGAGDVQGAHRAALSGGLTELSARLDAMQKAENWQGAGLGDGGYGAFNPRTGELKIIREPTKKPQPAPSGFRWRADGQGVEPIPGYVEGVERVTGARRDAIVARPMAKGGKGGSGKRSAQDMTEAELKALAGWK